MALLVVVTTTDSQSLALEISQQAVQRKLAACVQIVAPVTSVYRWKGKVETSSEYRCEMKTTSDHFESLRKMIVELHSYDVPEIVAMPIEAVSEDYRNWLLDQLANEGFSGAPD